MTINELNAHVANLEAELAHAEVAVATALEVQARAERETKKAQNAVAALQFQLERHARLREQLTETTASEEVPRVLLETAIQKAVRGTNAHLWTDEILKCLEAKQDEGGMTIFNMAHLYVSGVNGCLRIGQRERVWKVLQAWCPVRGEDAHFGIQLGLPKNWKTRYSLGLPK